MKIIAYLAVIGILIAVLCQITLSLVLGPYGYFADEMHVLNLSIVNDEEVTTPGPIVEGNNVTLSCDYLPDYEGKFIAYAFIYFHNGDVIGREKRRGTGIKVFRRWIRFEGINKTNSGSYICLIYTTRGLSLISQPLVLNVEDRPATTTEHPNLKVQKPNVTTENHHLKDKLNVSVQLTGDKSAPGRLAMFSDVNLTCNVTPNITNILKFRWFRGGVELESNVDAGIQIINSTLKLLHIQRNFSGMYFCQIETKNQTLCSRPTRIDVSRKITVEEIKEQLKTRIKPQNDFSTATAKPVPLTLHAKLGKKVNASDIRKFDDVYFTCEIEPNGINPPKVEWYYNNSEILKPDPARGIVYVNSTLLLQHIPKSAAGYYYCMAEVNKSMEISTTVLMEVKEKLPDTTNASDFRCTKDKVTPYAFVQLRNGKHPDSVIESEDVYMTCTLYPRGVARIKQIHWYRDHKKLYKDEIIGLINEDTTLVLPKIGKYFAAAYECAVITDIGRFDSNYILLQVQDPSVRLEPTVSMKLGDRSKLDDIRELDNVYIKCDIKPDFRNVLMLRWYRNGTELTEPNDEFKILDFSYILVLPSIKKTASGKYQCILETKLRNFVHSETLEITVKPATNDVREAREPLIITELVDFPGIINVNTNVLFYCYFYPNISSYFGLRWYYNGSLIDYSQNSQKYVAISQNLYIIRAQKYDVGNYSCEVLCDEKTPESIPAELSSIVDQPRMVTYSPNYNVSTKLTVELLVDDPTGIHAEDNVFLYCNVTPSTIKVRSITWLRNEREMNELAGCFCRNITFDGRTLIMHGVDELDAGKYTCQIETDQGTVFTSSPTELAIQSPRPTYTYSFDQGKPKVFAMWGDAKEINTSDIYEADNIYLTCKIEPNTTKTFEITWFRGVQIIYPKLMHDTVQEDRNLFFYDIKRTFSGDYACRVVTKKGTYTSNSVRIDVKCPSIPTDTPCDESDNFPKQPNGKQ